MRNFKLWFVIYGLSFVGMIMSLFAGAVVGWIVYNPVNHLDTIKTPIIPLLVTTIILTLILMLFVSHLFIRPLNQLIAALRKVSKRDFNVSLDEEHGLSEIRDMNKNFNRMILELSNTETLRNDFVSNVSHEFKTPLASIEGYASLMLNPEASDIELRDYAKKIMLSTRQLSSLTGNILSLSRLNAGTINDKAKLFSLDEQLREAILSLEPQWSKKNIDIDIDLPEISIFGYQNMLFQVWTNIYSNAIKFSPDDSTITTRIRKSENGVYVSIQDRGIGMTELQMHHIFDKFYQADTTHKSDGNGLGLAISAKIIDLSQGTISVDSEPGMGSTFSIYLPYKLTPNQESVV